MSSGAESFDHLAGTSEDAALPTEDAFVLEVRVAGVGAHHVHHLETGPGGYTYRAGAAESPDAWVTIGSEVADALRAGTVSVTAAVQSGRIRVGGDLQALLTHQEALAVVAQRVADRADGTGPPQP